jgi:hypothetical protein
MAQDPTHYDAVITDLEGRRDQLNAMIEMLKQMKSGASTSPVAGASSTPITSMATEIPHDAFFGMTIPEAAKKYLALVKRTAPHPTLCDALLEGGFKTSAANFREVVRSTLGRNFEFVKVSGQWGLAEWYGNRGTRKAKRVSEPPDGTALLPGTEAPVPRDEIEVAKGV